MYMSSPPGGIFNTEKVPRVKSLYQAMEWTQGTQPFLVKPGGSGFGTFEGFTSQVAPTQSTSWQQLVAKPSEQMSSKYENLVKSMSVTDLTRANKALVKGSSGSLSPQQGVNTWRDKTYSNAGQTTATLLRINEPYAAFGKQSIGSTTDDVGRGLMARVLSSKWNARNTGTEVSMPDLLPQLTKRYPQLGSGGASKALKLGPEALRKQIAESLMEAAVSAGVRGYHKKKSDLNEYVQRKFAKHGLGTVPGGWMEGVKKRVL
ncbi:MAG TPA: hypothetical protein VF801_11115 [Rhodocyclaceae bacterium]